MNKTAIDAESRNASASARVISVRGARTHNLRSVDLDIPRDRIVVLTGVSGSGKSSLAFDTIFAEGRRRFLETLSLSARRMIEEVDRPDVDSIEGLPPTIAIDQKTASPSPRGTVATITEIHDDLRVLYARLSVPKCPRCGAEVKPRTIDEIAATVSGMTQGTKVVVLAAIKRKDEGDEPAALRAIKAAGLLRARIDGSIQEIDPPPPPPAQGDRAIDAVVDRLVVREGFEARLVQSLSLALKLGDGSVIFSVERRAGVWEDLAFSVKNACPNCAIAFDRLEPASFSFNHPKGACPQCRGLGFKAAFDPELVVPDRRRSIAEGVIAPWRVENLKTRERLGYDPSLFEFLNSNNLNIKTVISDWSNDIFRTFLYGDSSPADSTDSSLDRYPGLIPKLERLWETTKSDALADHLERFRFEEICARCEGTRLRAESRGAALQGTTLPDLLKWNSIDASETIRNWTFEAPAGRWSKPMIDSIVARLAFLDRVGLAYLTLDRRTDTLSGGELQRLRLASRIGSGVAGACYVLDEPTAGLHPRDADRLFDCLVELKAKSEGLIIVEHDETIIRRADRLIEIGPGGGGRGGTIVAEGSLADLAANPQSATGFYLSRKGRSPRSELRGAGSKIAEAITISGATEHNLKNITVSFPLNALTCVTGVSGSGKSSLVFDVLADSARRKLEGRAARASAGIVAGLELIDKVILVDQKPLGRSSRSTAATYTGALDAIRAAFARTREAKARGFTPARFSFNNSAGRCDRCRGSGTRRVSIGPIADLEARCEACRGKRFNQRTLEILYKGKSIADVLELEVADAARFFADTPRIARALKSLIDAGLSYLPLGQATTDLSGGEARRVKLAAELGRPDTGRTLFLLDEPTTGLHSADIAGLVALLDRIVATGNTVIVVEHNLDLIAEADHLIDLGPEGGNAGGSIVDLGTPAELARSGKGATADALRAYFAADRINNKS